LVLVLTELGVAFAGQPKAWVFRGLGGGVDRNAFQVKPGLLAVFGNRHQMTHGGIPVAGQVNAVDGGGQGIVRHRERDGRLTGIGSQPG
jgi:hypothetical protein